MKSKFSIVGLLAIAVIGLSASLIQADFAQCVVGTTCWPGEGFGSVNSDVFNGTPEDDIILGDGAGNGNDVIFGHEGDDAIAGDQGNDVIFGGPGSDSIFGLDDDDILFPGPDRVGAGGQFANGTNGNDVVNVFAGEISTCLIIFNANDFDTVNLLGFGPYAAVSPFGQPGFVEGVVHVVDPIAGGDIYIHKIEATNNGTEVINGLLSPNATILALDDPDVLDCFTNLERGSGTPAP
jgi:Ca2+-binding RTX toxin-like protein